MKFSNIGRLISIAKEFRINERIRVPAVRVIDDKGLQLGVLTVKEALTMARDLDLDLVEVAPTSDPPVCRLLDYGKFKYLQSTKERELRRSNKQFLLREVRFSTRIGTHDIQAKQRIIQRLLKEGSKVKVSVRFRGREMQHPELGVNLLRQVAEELKEVSKLDQTPNMEGRFLSIVLAPIKPEQKLTEKQDPEQADEMEELITNAQTEDS